MQNFKVKFKIYQKIYRFLIVILTFSFLFFNLNISVFADVQDEIVERQKQIEELQRQIAQYQQEIIANQSQARTLETEINGLNAQINQIQLTIRSLELSINQASAEISETESQVVDLENTALKHKAALAQFLKITYENDQKTLTEILLSNDNLSDFFNAINDVRANQENLQLTIEEIKTIKTELEEHQENLENKKSEFERLRGLEAIEKTGLDRTKKTKDSILKETKGQEKKFQELVQKSQKDIEKIREQLTFLQQHGIAAEDAVKYAQLAAISAGIRPAFLLAILEIESRLGQNVGTGNWKDDMYECYIRLATIYYPHRKSYYLQRAETEKNAFFAIVNKLGINPDSVKVSREPNYGCGGAMGPAQFIPSTWLSYEEEVARLTGNNPPNPWSIEDAFTASAIKLARGGANTKTRAGENSAARAYIGGSTRCSSSICNYYANTVLRKADEIEKNL